MPFSSADSSPASSRRGSSHSSSSSSFGSPSSASSSGEQSTPKITRWFIDTRSLWPGDNIRDSASEYLAVISDLERRNVLRKYHVADARMALASALLKRAYVAKVTGMPWADIRFARRGHPLHGKPCWSAPKYLPAAGKSWPQIDFNVSHQAGLATLVGVCIAGGNTSNTGEDEVSVGCDIVAPNERADIAAINASDFEDFTSTYDEVFSADELFDITYNLPSNAVTLLNGQRLDSKTLGRLDRTILSDQTLSVHLPDGRTEEFSSDLIIDAKLRQFYTFFCLKEAYIKLVGEGLLAPWIKQCEFRQVRAPAPGISGSFGGKTTGGRSAIKSAMAKFANAPVRETEEMEIWLRDEEVHDVITEVVAFEENFMISTMIRPATALGPKAEFPPWERVNLEKDVLAFAVSSAMQTAMNASIAQPIAFPTMMKKATMETALNMNMLSKAVQAAMPVHKIPLDDRFAKRYGPGRVLAN